MFFLKKIYTLFFCLRARTDMTTLSIAAPHDRDKSIYRFYFQNLSEAVLLKVNNTIYFLPKNKIIEKIITCKLLGSSEVTYSLAQGQVNGKDEDTFRGEVYAPQSEMSRTVNNQPDQDMVLRVLNLLWLEHEFPRNFKKYDDNVELLVTGEKSEFLTDKCGMYAHVCRALRYERGLKAFTKHIAKDLQHYIVSNLDKTMMETVRERYGIEKSGGFQVSDNWDEMFALHHWMFGTVDSINKYMVEQPE